MSLPPQPSRTGNYSPDPHQVSHQDSPSNPPLSLNSSIISNSLHPRKSHHTHQPSDSTSTLLVDSTSDGKADIYTYTDSHTFSNKADPHFRVSQQAPSNLQSATGSSSTPLTIYAGLFLSVLIAILHHMFLSYLDGRNVADYNQFWTKNAGNTLAHGVAITLGMVATSALVQTVSDQSNFRNSNRSIYG